MEVVFICIRTVKIRSTDGTVRFLRNVPHVPDLKRNLTSLGVLDDARYWFKAENGSLKALKGSLVIFKADKINGFYFLQEEILNDSTNVAVSTISKNTKL